MNRLVYDIEIANPIPNKDARIDCDNYLTIGFNSRSFDDKIMLARGITDFQTDYDLLEEIRIAAGFKANFQSVTRGYSYSLDAISKANGFAKTGDSAIAPLLWQRGEKQRVVDCAMIDCDVTSAILDLGLAGQLVDPNTGNKLLLRGLEDVSS
jgi:hypothetical protein